MFFHYEGSPPPLDYPRPTKIDQNGTRHPISKIGICHLIIDELWFSFRQPASMGISILLANKTMPTIRSSANICSIIMDMPAIFNATEDLISSDTDHSPLLRLCGHALN